MHPISTPPMIAMAIQPVREIRFNKAVIISVRPKPVRRGYVGHGYQAKPFRSADLGPANQREPNASISRRVFDDRRAGHQKAFLFRIRDDAQRGSVFHRAAGIHKFRVAQKFATGKFGKAAQPDQRHFSDVPLHSLVAMFVQMQFQLSGRSSVIWALSYFLYIKRHDCSHIKRQNNAVNGFANNSRKLKESFGQLTKLILGGFHLLYQH